MCELGLVEISKSMLFGCKYHFNSFLSPFLLPLPPYFLLSIVPFSLWATLFPCALSFLSQEHSYMKVFPQISFYLDCLHLWFLSILSSSSIYLVYPSDYYAIFILYCIISTKNLLFIICNPNIESSSCINVALFVI